MQLFQSCTSSKSNKILITNDIITTPRQQEKSLQQYLFKDLSRSHDAIKRKEVNQSQINGISNRKDSPQSENINSSDIYTSPEKQLEMQSMDLNGNQFSLPLKNIKSGMSYFLGKKNLTISEQEVMDQLEGIDVSRIQNNGSMPRLWRYKFFNILGWIAKYIRYVRLRLIQFHPNEYLSQLHFDIINDVSYFNPPNDVGSDYFMNLINRDKIALMNEQKNFSQFYKSFTKSTRKLQQWLKRKTTSFTKGFFHLIENIQISQTFFKYWDILMMFVLIGEIMFVSLKISFDGFIGQRSFDLIQIPFLIFLFLDIILCFFKGFQDKGVFQIETRTCFKNYLMGHFSLDITCLMIYLIAYYSESLFIFCIFLIRLINKYYRYQLSITESFQLNERFGNEKVKLIELVFTIFLLAHLFSCIWYWIGYNSLETQAQSISSMTNQKIQISWIQTYNLDSSPWQDKYIASLFWVFTTMTTIGFGDIVPVNKNERLIAICIMMLSCFVFAYSVNYIGVLLKAINEKESIHRLRLKSMNSYMNDKKISETLQSKVRCYLDYIYQEEKNGASQNECISLDFLNNNLRESLLNEANFHVLVKMKIFDIHNYSFSQQFLQDLTIKMEEKIYFPDDVISHQGQVDPQIYFVSKGQVKILVHKSGKDLKPSLLQHFQAGQTFGQYNFFSLQKTPYTTVATSVTTIKYLRYEDFVAVIQSYPEDFEKYCMLKESLLLQSNFDILNITCSLCSWGNHQEIDCPLVNFKPQKNLVICKFDHSIPMPRNTNFKRRFHRKPNSYSINQVVSEQAKEFQEDKGFNVLDQKAQFQGYTPHPNLQLQPSSHNINVGFKEYVQYASNMQKNNQNNWNVKFQSSSNLNMPETPFLHQSPQDNSFIERTRCQVINEDDQRIEQNHRDSANLQITMFDKYLDVSKNYTSANQKTENTDNHQNYNYLQGQILHDPNFSVPGTNVQLGFQTVKHQQNEQVFRMNSRHASSRVDMKPTEILRYGSFKNIQEDHDKYMLNITHTNNNKINSLAEIDHTFEDYSRQPINTYYSMRGIISYEPQIKGDEIEIDKLRIFQFYRFKDNYIFHIEQYNLIQESHRQKLSLSCEKKTKRKGHQKTNIFNLTKSTLVLNNS